MYHNLINTFGITMNDIAGLQIKMNCQNSYFKPSNKTCNQGKYKRDNMHLIYISATNNAVSDV